MRIIKIEGNVQDVLPMKNGRVPWGLWGTSPAHAIIETEVCSLPTQIRYVIYRHKDARLYCKVQRQRVFLEDLDGYHEALGV